MADLAVLTEMLRLQRQDIDEMLEQTLSRSSQAAELVGKIEELRHRSEDTLRRFRAQESGEQAAGDKTVQGSGGAPRREGG